MKLIGTNLLKRYKSKKLLRKLRLYQVEIVGLLWYYRA
jgi:hypothetical protein